MTDVTITLDDEKARRLEARARAAGGSAAQLLTQVAIELADADAVEPLPPEVMAQALRRGARPLGGEHDAHAGLREVVRRYGLELDVQEPENA